jgi:hypothetical protein
MLGLGLKKRTGIEAGCWIQLGVYYSETYRLSIVHLVARHRSPFQLLFTADRSKVLFHLDDLRPVDLGADDALVDVAGAVQGLRGLDRLAEVE